MVDLMTLPECSKHGQMEFQPACTPEQAWCGVWYRCRTCTNTVLLRSANVDPTPASKTEGGSEL